MGKRVGYFNLNFVCTLILAILPLNPIFGIIERILRKNYFGAVMNLILFPIMYIVDLVTVLVLKDIIIWA